MPTFNSQQYALTQTTPPQKVGAGLWGAKLKPFYARIDLATVNGGSAVAVNDDVRLFDIPFGVVATGLIAVKSSVALTGATLNIGITGNTDKYGIFAAPGANTLTWNGRPAEYDTSTPLAAGETVLATVTGANLPTSGIVEVFFFVTTE